MDGKYLLDTNIVIALLRGETLVVKFLSKLKNSFVPSVVVGELYYGARRSSQKSDNLKIIDEFVTENIVLSCNLETAELYGLIKSELHSKGKPIPDNDIWIAAIGKQYNLTVLSRDKHFSFITNLKIKAI